MRKNFITSMTFPTLANLANIYFFFKVCFMLKNNITFIYTGEILFGRKSSRKKNDLDRQLQKELNHLQGKLLLSVHLVVLLCVHRHSDLDLHQTQRVTEDSLLVVQQCPSCLHRHLSRTHHPLENGDSMEDASAGTRKANTILCAQASGA